MNIERVPARGQFLTSGILLNDAPGYRMGEPGNVREPMWVICR